MIHVTSDFIAIPKEFEWPEDLEDGIFSIKDNVQIIYQPAFESYAVYVNDEFFTDFSLEKYWIFVKGDLRNGKTKSDTSYGD